MRKYIVGVDGGNSKTDYFIFDTDLNFIDAIRSGTCSHEGLIDSFEGSYRVMKENFDLLFRRNNIKYSDVAVGVFGLAGVDTPYQKKRLEEVVSKLGFKNYRVCNDSILPIKAASSKGYGVCSINGTGTCAGGIDKHGNSLQVGGIGEIVGDAAGGHWLGRRAITEVYNSFYRFGKKTMLEKDVLGFLEITDPYYMVEKISGNYCNIRKFLGKLCRKVFEYANLGDEVSINLLHEMANNLARSAGGCVANLDFDDEVEVVLAGSVFVKGESPILIEEFTKKITEYTNKNIKIVILKAPPVSGAIIWAKEIVDNNYPSLDNRKILCDLLEAKLNQMEGK